MRRKKTKHTETQTVSLRAAVVGEGVGNEGKRVDINLCRYATINHR